VEMSYLRGPCSLSRMESVYGRFGMSAKGEGMNCGVVEVVKRNTCRWFGYLERMGESEMTRRIYKGGLDAVGVRGRPPVKWEDRLLEYMRERRDRGCKSEMYGQEQVETSAMATLEEVPRNRHQSRLDYH